tara:strand:- start:419 stop:1195 length:777 start_codon:yes stop_codon:yes gene_type:complete
MVTFVFPMAGASSRFFAAGYTKKKYMLSLHEISLFDAVLNGFRRYFNSGKFVFVIQSRNQDTQEFVLERCRALGLDKSTVQIINLPKPTAGQAETVFQGIGFANIELGEPLTIFNIDTIRREFQFPRFLDQLDTVGYLEVFHGKGDHWSFVKTGTDGLVTQVTEKLRISEHCSTGLYYFRTAKDFIDAYGAFAAITVDKLQGGERYVAPLYNYLIQKNLPVRIDCISNDQVAFCGTPAEYQDILLRWSRDDLRYWTGL